jgi:hypothetical protein
MDNKSDMPKTDYKSLILTKTNPVKTKSADWRILRIQVITKGIFVGCRWKKVLMKYELTF